MDHLKSWVGRTQKASDVLTPRLVEGFRAVLDEGGPARLDRGAAPVGIHWCLAPEAPSQSSLGSDGHPSRGDFLPPVPLERRMWAAGTVEFFDPLRIGDPVERTSTVKDVNFKEGRSGALCFVTVEHQIDTPRGQSIRERQDIVYRDAGASREPSRRPENPPLPAAQWQRQLCPDPALLFRYSALTFNAHRIHYDRNYCTEAEDYPGLVVHGPLQATLLLRLSATIDGTPPARFIFRAVRPLFDGSVLTLNAAAETGQARKVQLWTTDPEGAPTMTAEAQW